MLGLQHAEPTANSTRSLRSLNGKQLGVVSHCLAWLRFEQHRPEYTTINRNGQVPVLVHDGAIISKSTAIDDQLERFVPPTSLRSSDPGERARMRIRSRFVDEKLLAPPSAGGTDISCFAKPQQARTRRGAGQDHVRVAARQLRNHRQQIVQRGGSLPISTWIGGGSWSLAVVIG